MFATGVVVAVTAPATPYIAGAAAIVMVAAGATSYHIVGLNIGPGSYFMKSEIIARSCAP
jgi:hypothetical protein